MTAFRPGQSPPLVRMPIFMLLRFSMRLSMRPLNHARTRGAAQNRTGRTEPPGVSGSEAERPLQLGRAGRRTRPCGQQLLLDPVQERRASLPGVRSAAEQLHLPLAPFLRAAAAEVLT